MDSNPLVSCIIIFLNGEKFIEEAIESIFSQTYPNWELLLIDDGSTDNSTIIALEYAQKYSKNVRYLEHENHENRGMSASRNWGIDHAQGKYIAFLDADDIWLPDKLEQQVAILESQPEAAMVYGRTKHWYSWTGNPEDKQRDYFMDLGVPPNTLVMPPKLLYSLWISTTQPPIPSNAMIRRSIFNSIGQFEPIFRGSAEDKVFYTKVELNKPVFVANNYWAAHREHQNSSTAVSIQSRKKISEAQSFLNWVEKYLLEQGIKDSQVWRAFEKARFPYRHPILYFFWRGYLELLMSIGRRILSVKLRHWLWINLVSKLYKMNIEKSMQSNVKS
jgi:glycosyltransferase involved in cell wall biosynthesis